MRPDFWTPAFVADLLQRPLPDWSTATTEHFARVIAHPQAPIHFAGDVSGHLARVLGCKSGEEFPAYDAVLAEWLGQMYIPATILQHVGALAEEEIIAILEHARDWDMAHQAVRAVWIAYIEDGLESEQEDELFDAA